MSTTGEQLRLGGDPRVDLMPPEVREKRRGRGIRRLLVLALVGAVLIIGAGYGVATVGALAATAALEQAQARTTDLVAQQAQYAEVTQLEGRRDRLAADRALVTAREVFWKQQLDPVLGRLPEGAVIVGLQARSATLVEGDMQPAGVLRQPRVAEVSLQIFTPTIPPVTAWSRALEATPAFADSLPILVTRDEERGGYVTSVTLNLSDAALALRFADPAPDTDTDDADAETASEPEADAGADAQEDDQ